MEKLIYLLERSGSMSVTDFRSEVTGGAVDVLRAAGAHDIVVNVADLHDEISAANPGRLIGGDDVGAAVSFWIDSIDTRRPVEDHLGTVAASMHGYLVTESVPQPFDREWSDGQRRPGLTQFGANGKPADVTDDEFYESWQGRHTPHSFELHPRRWSYVRNAVARSLTSDAPPYRAIVAEHWRDIDDFTDDERYFGSAEAVEEMMAELPNFCDFGLMFSVPMSEYHYA